MKCTVTREQLLEPVVQADKITVKKHTLPVLGCVVLEVTEDTLTITATNLEVGVRYSVSVTQTEQGVVAISGSVLSHVISSLSNGAEVHLSTEEGYLLVESVEGVSRLALQSVEDFPTLPEVRDAVEISLPVKEFRDTVGAVLYCASTSTIKPELSSVFVHAHQGFLIAAATDSFRLAEKRTVLKNSVDADPFLLPSKTAGILLRTLEGMEGEVTLVTNKHQLSIRFPSLYITLRLTAGTFPDYTQVIPKEFSTEATVLVLDFERVLRKASIFSDQFNQTTLSVSPKKKNFEVFTKNDTVGETKDILHAALTGEDITIRFNQKYLIDSLHSISSDSITLQFGGAFQPAVIRPVGNDGFLYLVSSMNR